MKTFAKILALALCVLFVCTAGTAMAEDGCTHSFSDGVCTACSIPGGYYGDSTNPGGETYNIWWTYAKGTLTIGGTGETDVGNNYNMPWKAYEESITTIVVEDGVTVLKNYLFSTCTAAQTIHIPASVTSIDAMAFTDCTALNAIHVAEGSSAYQSIDGVLYSADGKTLVLYPEGKTAASVITRAGVTTIGENAFYGNKNIKSITLSEGVTTISDNAIVCSALETLSLPDSLITIGEYAFNSCPALTTVNVPCTWKENPLYTFADTVTLNYIHTYSNTCCGYCGAEGDGTNVKWSLVDGALTITGEGAMADYDSFKDSPWYTYRNSITALTIQEGVTTIGRWAFCQTAELKSVTIPASVTKLGYAAFVYSGLESVTFAGESQLTTIDSFAFQHCDALTEITLPAGVGSFRYDLVFDDCTALTDIHVAEGNTTYKDIDGVLYTADGTTLMYYPEGKTAASFTIPAGVTTIGQEAFSDNGNIKSVTLSEGVKTIGSQAFLRCKALTEVNIPASVESIGVHAFYDCTALTTVTIPASVTSIGSGAFESCSSLTTVNAPCTWEETPLYTFDSTVTLNYIHAAGKYSDNGNGTHNRLCAQCEEVLETEEHDFGENGTCQCTVQAVAKVHDMFYGDIAKALSAWANNGGTLTLLADVSYTGTDVISLLQEISCTFVGGDYTLEMADPIYVDGNLTIRSGEIKYTGNNYAIHNTGMLHVMGGSITAPNGAGINANSRDNIPGTVIIEDGVTVTSKYACVTAASGGQVTINGGKFTSDNNALQFNGGAVTINGGVLTSVEEELIIYDAASKLTIGAHVVPDEGWDLLNFEGDTALDLSQSLILPGDHGVYMNNKPVETLNKGETCIILSHKHEWTIGIDNGDGTHTITCIKGETAKEAHTLDENGWCECGARAVAKVNDALYSDIAAAMEEWANNGGTLTLLKDAAYANEYELYLMSETPYTFVGGGCTLELETTFNNYGQLTIESGTLKQTTGLPVITNNGTLHVKGGHIASPEGSSIDNMNSLTIEAGVTVTAGYACINDFQSWTPNACQITINGGTFNSDRYVIELYGGNVTINGGSLKSGNGWEFLFQKAAGKVYIANGVIPADGWEVYSNVDTPITLSDCLSLPSDYYVFVDDKAIDTLEQAQVGVIKFHEHDWTIGADNSDGTHQVDCACGKTSNENHRYDETGKCECTALAVAAVTIDGATLYCDTLEDALAAANGNTATVKLLADGELPYNATFYSPSDVTLNLSGKTITSVGCLTVANGASLTITGNGTYKNINSSNNNAFNVASTGKLTIENGTFEATGTYSTLILSSGILNIQGGAFTATANRLSIPLMLTDNSIVTVTGSPVFKGPDDQLNDDGNILYGREFSLISSSAKLDLSGVTGSMDGWRVENSNITDGLAVGSHLILPASGYAMKQGDQLVTTLTTGTVGTIVAHSHTYTTDDYDETHHWTACACGATTEKEKHVLTYFSNDDGTTHDYACACGLTVIANESHSFLAENRYQCLCGLQACAQVGDVLYADFSKALDAWTNDTTLTLLADVTYSGDAIIKRDMYVELALNGHTLTSNAVIAVESGHIVSTLTISGPGSITCTALGCVAGGKLVVSGDVALHGSSEEIAYDGGKIDLSGAVDPEGWKIHVVTTVIPTITFGFDDTCDVKLPDGFAALDSTGSVTTSAASGSIVTISAHSHDYIMQKDETHHWKVCACGSELVDSKKEHKYDALTDQQDGKTHIAACECGATKLENHTFTKDAAGEYACECSAKPVAVTSGENMSTIYHGDFKEALDAWTTGATLTLLADVTYDSNIELGRGAIRIFVGEGYTLDLGSSQITNLGTLTIESGTIKAANLSNAIDNQSVLTIKNATIINNDNYAVSNSGTLEAEGGILTGSGGLNNAAGASAMLTGTTLQDVTCIGDVTLTNCTITADVFGIYYAGGTLTIVGDCAGWEFYVDIVSAAFGTDIILPDDYYLFDDTGKIVTTLGNGDVVTIGKHTDDNHVFACTDNSDGLTHTKTCTIGCGLATVTDEPHTYDAATGKCTCGAVIVASFAQSSGTTTYWSSFGSVNDHLSGKTGTLTLYADHTEETGAGGTLNIIKGADIILDLNGHYSKPGFIVWDGVNNGAAPSKLTVVDSSKNPTAFELVWSVEPGNTLVIDSSGACEGFSVQNGASAGEVAVGKEIILPEGYVLLDEDGKEVTTLAGYAGAELHRHSFSYVVSGAVITESCSGGDWCVDAKLTLLVPENAVYDGTAKAASFNGDPLRGANSVSITYTPAENSTAPVNAGSYTATLTAYAADGTSVVSASQDFTIAQAALTAASQEITRAYTASAELKAVPLTLTGRFGSDDVSATADFQLLATKVGEYNEATLLTMPVLSGTHAGNYALAPEAVTFTKATITKAAADLWSAPLASPQDILIGSDLTAIAYPTQGTGIGEEMVPILSVSTYTDAQMTTLLTDDAVKAAAKGDTLTVYTRLSAENYEDRIVEHTLTFIDHEHAWAYAANADHTAIIASCSGSVGVCPIGNKTVTYSLDIPGSLVYDGTAKAAGYLTTFSPEDADLSSLAAPSIAYTLAGEPVASPVNAGEYTVTLTLDAASISVPMTITPAALPSGASLAKQEDVYNGQAHQVSIQYGALVEGTDYAVTYPQNMTGAGNKVITLAGIGNYTGTISLNYTIARASIANAVVTAPDQVYTGKALEPAMTVVLDGKTLIPNQDYTFNWMNNVNVGEAVITVSGIGNYVDEASGTFAITTSASAITAKTDKPAYTYGDTLTVTAAVQATGKAPQTATFGLLRAATPTMSLILKGADNTETELATASEKNANGEYVLTYDTRGKAIVVGAANLIVRYSGDANMAPQDATVSFSLNPLTVTPVLTGSTTKVYDGTTTVTDIKDLSILLSDVLSTDSVAVGADFAYVDANAGTGKTITASSIALGIQGDEAFYALSSTTASADIGTITKAIPTAALFTYTAPADLVYDGKTKAAQVTATDTGLGEITIRYDAEPVSVGAYKVSIDVAEGTNFAAAAGITDDSWTFAITTSASAITAKTDKPAYTYGDTLTVTAAVQATGKAPQTATFGLLRAATPTMSLILKGADNTETELATASEKNANGEYVLTYDTRSKAIAVGAASLIVRYSGDANMAPQDATVSFSLNPLTVTPMLTGSTTKVYDGTTIVTDIKDLSILLSDVLSTDSVAVGADFAYADANAGTGKTITASSIALGTQGDEAFYALSSTTASADIGMITKAIPTAALFTYTAPADLVYDGKTKAAQVTATDTGLGEITIRYDAEPVSVGAYKVFIDVTEGTNFAAAAGITDDSWTFTIAKGTPAASTPAITAYYGQTLADILPTATELGTWNWVLDAGVKPEEVTVGEVGTRTFKITFNPADEANWKAMTFDAVVTVVKAGTMFDGGLTIRNGEIETSIFTYGDTITVLVRPEPARPATFSLRAFAAPTANEMALFYGDVQLSNAVKPDASGLYTMTVATSNKDLPIGASTITAKYVGTENMGDYSQSAEITLLPKPLTVESVTTKPRIYDAGVTAVVLDVVTLSGKALDTDDVAYDDATMQYGDVGSDQIGKYTEITLPKLLLKGAHAGFYTVESVTLAADAEILAVPTDLMTKVEISETFTDADIPQELKETGITTVKQIAEKLETLLRTQITQNGSVMPMEDSILYDVELQYWEPSTKQWLRADKEHFPESGRLPILLPLPAGTDSTTHDFRVAHMFTSSAFGKIPGDVEFPAVTIVTMDGKEYLSFEVTGLSPIMVTWMEKPVVIDLPDTGDSSRLSLWLLLMGASLTGVLLLMKRRRA